MFLNVICSVYCIVGSDSESLQDDNVVGNISKYSVVAPGYAGPIKRGHLIFNADFECGKCHFCHPRDAMLARVIVIATCLSVRPSVRPERAGIVSKRRKLAA